MAPRREKKYSQENHQKFMYVLNGHKFVLMTTIVSGHHLVLTLPMNFWAFRVTHTSVVCAIHRTYDEHPPSIPQHLQESRPQWGWSCHLNDMEKVTNVLFMTNKCAKNFHMHTRVECSTLTPNVYFIKVGVLLGNIHTTSSLSSYLSISLYIPAPTHFLIPLFIHLAWLDYFSR